MARDRKRAKQRQQRRTPAPARPAAGTEPDLSQPRHENAPGELEHASGDVAEFDARLIAGAGGEVADAAPPSTREEIERGAGLPAEGGDDDGDDGGSLPAVAGDGAEGPRVPAARGPHPGGNRVVNFLRASWAELQRVQWPDRRQVAQATGVVLGFVAIAGAYLGLADLVAQKVVDAIL